MGKRERENRLRPRRKVTPPPLLLILLRHSSSRRAQTRTRVRESRTCRTAQLPVPINDARELPLRRRLKGHLIVVVVVHHRWEVREVVFPLSSSWSSCAVSSRRLDKVGGHHPRSGMVRCDTCCCRVLPAGEVLLLSDVEGGDGRKSRTRRTRSVRGGKSVRTETLVVRRCEALAGFGAD
jgi:hypothetical protein